MEVLVCSQFRCLGPADVLAHERQGAVDVPTIEGRVGLSDQRLCIRRLCVRHESSGMRMRTLQIDARNAPEARSKQGLLCLSA